MLLWQCAFSVRRLSSYISAIPNISLSLCGRRRTPGICPSPLLEISSPRGLIPEEISNQLKDQASAIRSLSLIGASGGISSILTWIGGFEGYLERLFLVHRYLLTIDSIEAIRRVRIVAWKMRFEVLNWRRSPKSSRASKTLN